MIKLLVRNKTFIIGFSFVAILLALSIGNTVFNDGQIRTVSIIMDDQANIVDAPPYEPFTHGFIAGSDFGGKDLLHMVIHGAKFTIGIAFLIACLRVVFSLALGSVLGVYFQKYIRWFEKLNDPITVIPLTLVAYFVLFQVVVFNGMGSPHSFWERTLFQVGILTFYAVPTLAIYQANEIKKLHHEEFMEAANVLGGSKWHKLRKHILPHLKENLFIILMQQYIQVLVVLAHLGVLEIFFGGTFMDSDGKAYSISYEWAGLIGNSYNSMITHPWLPLVPIVFLGLTILSAQMMLSGFKDVLDNKHRYVMKEAKSKSRYFKKKDTSLNG